MHALVECLLRRVGRRIVQVCDGLCESPQPPGLARPWRKRFAQIRRIASKRAAHELAQCVLGQTRGGRIYRRQAIRQRRSDIDDLESGVNHFQAAVTLANVTEGAHPPSRSERFVLARIKVKKTQHQLRITFHDQTHELPSAPILDLAMNYGALDLPCLTRLHRAQWAKMRASCVTHWQMKH